MATGRNTVGRALAASGVVLLTIPALPVSVGHAGGYAGFIDLVTDSSRVFGIPKVPRPAYRIPVADPTFGTPVSRIAGDPVGSTAPVTGSWGRDARHVYSKQQPWNSTGTLLSIENRAGGSPSPLILDGETYAPRYGKCVDYDQWDYRWHPSTAHPQEQINVNSTGVELMWFDVTTCTKTRSWTLPIRANDGIGSGEGNVSNDGRYVVIANDSSMVVVDMDPCAPNAPPYPYRRVGPVYVFPPCSLDVAARSNCPIGNISISPSGRYVDVKYSAVTLTGQSGCDTLCDMHRVYEVDTSLAIRPHNMAASSRRCGSFVWRPNGWIFPLKHADMMLDPFDNNEDVIIGGRACPGSNLGHLVKVRLRDGAVTSLTDPSNETGYSHGSARNIARSGWFYVTYSRAPAYQGRRFWGEIVAVKIDGSGSVQRFGHYHSTASVYRAQAHGVPSPDGRRILFASDWSDHCTVGCGSTSVFQDFVLDARSPNGAIPPGRKMEASSATPHPRR